MTRVGNDRYVERGMNTMPIPTIIKAIQTQDIEYAEKAVTATGYDIWDTDQMSSTNGKSAFTIIIINHGTGKKF